MNQLLNNILKVQPETNKQTDGYNWLYDMFQSLQDITQYFSQE